MRYYTTNFLEKTKNLGKCRLQIKWEISGYTPTQEASITFTKLP